jgi:26S proteasome regulatory subunit N2
MVGLTSAAGVVGFLSEPDPSLRSFALHRLNENIDLLWPEVAGSVSQMYDNTYLSFSSRSLPVPRCLSENPVETRWKGQGAFQSLVFPRLYWCFPSHSEALYEDDSFPERELAALVAAKVYYQLQEYNESMIFALGAGKLFDLHHPGEFEETILGKSSRSEHNPRLPEGVDAANVIVGG